FLLFIISISIALGVSEYLVRRYFPQVKSEHNQLFCQYDEVLGWKFIPYKGGKHITPEYTTSESFNSRGVRGPDRLYDKESRERRILVLGDSFAEGYSVEFEELFSSLLEHNLKARNDKFSYSVVNMGIAGYSTDQELLLFQREGKKYHPDLTIIMFYENDPWYNTQTQFWRGEKPL